MIDFSNIHLYQWGSLYWFEDEVLIGFSAISNLILNQEEVYSLKQKELISKRSKILPTIPEEHRDSYEQHFFEDADKIFNELKFIQRNSICLSFFSYLEGKLLELVKMIEREFGVQYKKANMEILASLYRYIVNTCKINGSTFKGEFKRIINQSIIRNSIAHNHSHISNIKRFKKEDGIILKDTKIIINDVVYLNNLINWARTFFKELFIAVDKKFNKVS